MKAEIRALAERSTHDCRGSGEWRRGICLACDLRTGKPDRRGSFSFNAGTGWYRCFKCGLVGRLDGDYADAVDRLQGEEPETLYIDPPESFYELGRGDGRTAECLEPHRQHLIKRGLTDEVLWREAHIGGCFEGYYRGRVIVPVLDPEGQWRGFVARAWEKKAQVPYLYPKGMNRRELLYNHAALLKRTDRPCFVVEGVMDALALWPDAVAVLGKPSDPQVFALADAPRPIVACLDGDAWEEGRTLAMTLQLEGQEAGFVRLPPGKDPDEMPREWLDEEARLCLG